MLYYTIIISYHNVSYQYYPQNIIIHSTKLLFATIKPLFEDFFFVHVHVYPVIV